MDFLNRREGGMVFYRGFLHSPFKCTIAEKSQGKAVEVTVNSKEENSWISSKNSAS
jgi:hypothetical protein